jgi:hypothetical protein
MGVEINVSPMSPKRVRDAVMAAALRLTPAKLEGAA